MTRTDWTTAPIDELTDEIESCLASPPAQYIGELIKKGRMKRALKALMREEGHWLPEAAAQRALEHWRKEIQASPAKKLIKKYKLLVGRHRVWSHDTKSLVPSKEIYVTYDPAADRGGHVSVKGGSVNPDTRGLVGCGPDMARRIAAALRVAAYIAAGKYVPEEPT